MFARASYYLYRCWIFMRSVWFLWTMPQTVLTKFLQSYDLYELDSDSRPYGPKKPEKLVHYYQVLNHLCSLGQVEKMYIPPYLNPWQGIQSNQLEFEMILEKDLGLQSESEVLDIGCGRGKVALGLYERRGCSVTGFNLDPEQLYHAHLYAKMCGATAKGKAHFFAFDLNNLPLPFPDNHFDAVYEIQAFSYCDDLPAMMKEIERILKPGGRFAMLDYIKLPNYDESNANHRLLLQKVKPLLGAQHTRSGEEVRDVVRKTPNLYLLFNGNLSIGEGQQTPLIRQANHYFSGLQKWMSRLLQWNLVPNHIGRLFARFTEGGEAFIQADTEKLVTTSFYVLAEKRLT